MTVTPFEVEWDPAVVAHVLARVAAYPFPVAPEGGGWNYGCDEDYLKGLCSYWIDGWAWQAAVADLNRFPQFMARVGGFDLHFLHVVGEAKGRRPLLIVHGWPGSHFEFWAVIERLAWPSRFGGQAADAFDLVIPSLPGFGYSSKPARPFGQRDTAALFDTLMRETLGYETYLAQGGDWGALVASWLGVDHGAAASGRGVRAVHLNMIGLRPPGPPQTDEERAWLARTRDAMQALGGYFALQASKPQSLAWAMADNPVGQAAWIVERFHDWADLRERPFEEAFSRDQLLTNVMLYVMTGSFTTAAWYYRSFLEEGGAALPEGVRGETPTAYADFPGEPLYTAPPRSWAERAYNLTRWTDMPRGGHFAAMEEPDLYVDEVRAWGRELDLQTR